MFLLIIILLCAGLSPAQESNIEKYQFISPLPGSKLIMPENNIIIRQGDIIDATTINEASIEVVGSISGFHSGEFFLSDEMRTLIFIPSIRFTPGEKVNVKLYSGIYTNNGDLLNPITFDFYISPTISENLREKLLNNVSDVQSLSPSTKDNPYSLNVSKTTNEDLPEDFPSITVNVSNNPSKGFIFFSPRTFPTQMGYLIIMDNNAIPIYYQRTPHPIIDFKVQTNGLLSFVKEHKMYFYMMDSSYNIIDSVRTGNGYITNSHEFQIMPNGHYLLMAFDPQPVRMDTIVPGGDPSAIVFGLIVQELDINKNVVFQWRSWDHFQITDATEDIDLTQHTIDYVHGNAIELDYDGNLLISSRHMDEITKINRQTGEIIWRWGGLKSKNNQFQFINDPITFSHQHDIRRLPNGNVTLYDNGNLHTAKISRAREYKLDESNKTSELIWAYTNEPSIYKSAEGNVQKLSGNNTLIGWGGKILQGVEAISEVQQDGSVVLEIFLADTFTNYRTFKFPWRTNLYITNPDSIFFESVSVGDSAIISVDLINNSADPIDITGYYNLNEDYVVENPVPFPLPAFGTVSLDIKFKPSEDGYFKDYLHIRSDTGTTRVAQVMFLAGRTDTIYSSVTEDEITYNYVLEQNYPNPFNPGTTIRYSIPTQSNVRLRVYNSIGENIADLINTNQSAGSYEVNWVAENVASGIYFYSIEAIPSDGTKIFRSVRKMILLK
jgi:hypothetical protein